MAMTPRSNMFLKLNGVDGEATDHTHENWIELDTLTWSVSNAASWQSTGKKHQGEVADISLTKKIDRASVTLFQKCFEGDQIDNGTISCLKLDGEKRVVYFRIKLEKIIVKKVVWTALSGEDVKEDVDLNFAVFKEKYTVQANSGDAGGHKSFGFDREKGVEVPC